MKTTPALLTLLSALVADMAADSYGDYGVALVTEAINRLDAQHQLLNRAADIMTYSYPTESLTAKWLAAAKEIGIEPCPF